MMDTDLIYRAVCTYGSAKRHGWEYQSGEYLEHVKHLLNEADEEHKSLLATNEKLVDEVNELKAKLTKKAELLRGCYAADHKQKQRIEELTSERDALKAELEGRYQSIIEMGNMLTEIVNLIRGEPEDGTSHSTHDAVELVRGLAMHNDLYATAVELEVAKLKAENERLLAANRDCIAHYEDARAELERIKALEPTHWQVTQGTRSFVMTAAEFNMSTFDYGSFVALYALGSKTYD